MAAVTLTNAPRIVCTKCVRIMRVHLFDVQPYDDTALVAAECCARTFGYVTGLVLHMHTRDGRDLTSNDIVPRDAVEFAKLWEERAARAKHLAQWARWTLHEAPPPE